MKNIFLFILLLVIFITGCTVLGGGKMASEPAEEVGAADAADESYEGSAMGYRGLITVQVRMSRGSIMDIVVLDSEEDRFVGAAAMEELIDIVAEYNSTDVDVISGATVTSRGFLEAVNRAMMKHE